VLYGYWRSSCTYRVRIVLNMKGIKYSYVPIHLRNNEQKQAEFTEKNPNQTVPVLVVGGVPLVQSLAIIDYLDETYPDPPLFPLDPIQKAQAKSIAHMIACDIQPLQNLRIMGKITPDPAKRTEWAKDVNKEGLERVEKAMSKTAGKYSFGDHVTLADICLVPQVYNAIRFGIDVEKVFPTIHRVYQELGKIEAFKLAHPDLQPDAEKDPPK